MKKLIFLIMVCSLILFNCSIIYGATIDKNSFDSGVSSKELLSIKNVEILEQPYSISEDINKLDGLKVSVTYENGVTELIDNSDKRLVIIGNNDKDNPRYQLFFNDKNNRLFLGNLYARAVKTRNQKNRGSIMWEMTQVFNYPNKSTYLLGEDYELDGFCFRITYNNGSEHEDIEYNNETAQYFTIENYNKDVRGKYSVKVIFDNGKYENEISWNFDVVVKTNENDKVVKDVVMGKAPDKYYYKFGEDIVFDGRKTCFHI